MFFKEEQLQNIGWSSQVIHVVHLGAPQMADT